MAHKFQLANEKYATDYPANVGPHMTNTDSTPFQDLTPSISLRESGTRRADRATAGIRIIISLRMSIRFLRDDDFRLGLNAAQTTLGAIGQLAGLR